MDSSIISNEPETQSAKTSAESTCANCGSTLVHQFCGHCGQHRRESKRLEVRQILMRFVEQLYDFDSAFLRTWRELSLRPGMVCREYVNGRRRLYMNPFAYLLLAITVVVVIGAVLTRLFPQLAAAANEDEDFDSSFILLLLVPLAIIWNRLFRSAGYNLAENYVFALYVFGHLTWIELLILSPLSLIVNETATWSAYAVVVLGYLGIAAKDFYRAHPWTVAWKLVFSMVLMTGVVMVIGAIQFAFGLR